jgi:hypothetical protein
MPETDLSPPLPPTAATRLLGWLVPNAPRLIGWAVVAIAAFLVITQVRYVARKKHGLPDIRHTIYWSKNLHTQALRNRSHAVSTDLAFFYLVEKVLANTELVVGPSLATHRWKLERVGRARVTESDVKDVPPEAWKDLAREASHTGMFGKRKLYVLARDAGVKTYVFVSTIGETAPLYIVPEKIYRARIGDNSGANLSAP